MKTIEPNSDRLQTVSIDIKTNMYKRFVDITNTPSHVLAEFVDNALQSFRDNKLLLEYLEPGYKMQVYINFDFDADGRVVGVDVMDNAGGINRAKFITAFQPAKGPENNEGLNEFGMGLKTAACWLGEDWKVETSALGEQEKRTVEFCLSDVCRDELTELPVKISEESKDAHYTRIYISSPTRNMPSKKSLSKIAADLSSIYRMSLRKNEFDLFLQDEKITFEEYPVLNVPYVHDPEGGNVLWKKEVCATMGRYKATGFIGILRDIKQGRNGFVILRRGRVVVGTESDHRFFPKFMGSLGTFRYKRLFGEIEVEGFNVSFNKNDITERENLEALLDLLKDQIKLPGFDMLKQADDYRVTAKKEVLNIIRKHNTTPKTKKQPVSLSSSITAASQESDIKMVPIVTSTDKEHIYEDTFHVDDEKYTLRVEFCEGGADLFVNDISDIDQNKILKCKINMNHPFFENIDEKKSASSVVLIKSMAIAKFVARKGGNDTVMDFMNIFNEYIKKVQS